MSRAKEFKTADAELRAIQHGQHTVSGDRFTELHRKLKIENICDESYRLYRGR